MKKTILLSIALLLVSMSFAQKDKKAEAILSKVSATYKAYNSFRVNFSLTMYNKEEFINDESMGSADIKNDMYKISIMGVDTYFDGKTRYSYLIDSEEINITEPDQEDSELANPAKIFDLYKTGFNYSIVKQYKSAEANLVEIKLIPIKEKDYSHVVLVINKDKSNVISFTTVGKDGNDVILKMIKLEIKHSFENSHFMLNLKKYPDAEVIDMRE
ncbi:MAG: outer membrane lipoprotein carrier protein LolA [Marinifilaceae bacterium]